MINSSDLIEDSTDVAPLLRPGLGGLRSERTPHQDQLLLRRKSRQHAVERLPPLAFEQLLQLTKYTVPTGAYAERLLLGLTLQEANRPIELEETCD